MKRINVLDQHTANKIAAGEVVERPSSVVKELIENSIDANANNITIEIEEGGINLIKIIDDGDGIYKDDIEIAFRPHATSKIKCVDDIYSINTLGFRGEALPSIAAVSNVVFKSKTSNNPFGKEIHIDAGNTIKIEDVGMNNGSVIEVRNIFFNIPARKKFLKSSSREGSLINDIVTRIAISNPNISFQLINNGKKILHTFGTGKLKDVIRSIYGKTVYDNIIYFHSVKDKIEVFGYIGNEHIAKGSRNSQSVFVNNRYIKNKTVIAAAENAFKSFSALNKFPFCIIFIIVPADFVDVNIHPTKAEIKFNDDRLIFKTLFDSIHKALKDSFFDSFNIEEEIKYKEDELVETISFNINENANFSISTINKDSDMDNIKKEIDINSVYNSITTEDIKREEDLYVKLKNLAKEPSKLSNEIHSDVHNTSHNHLNKEIDDNMNSTPKYPPLRVIGQFTKTYILAEYSEDLYIVDQHAAHEKILFEKYLKNIQSKEIVVQPLLIPCIIDLSMDDFSYYEDNKDVFIDAGFAIEHFGGNTISIKEVPYFLGKIDTKTLFYDILDNLKNLGTGKPIDVKFNKIATMACKAAIKANDYLSNIEMEKLIEDLRYIDDPFHCPHGRPIILKFTEYELNKKFRRII